MRTPLAASAAQKRVWVRERCAEDLDAGQLYRYCCPALAVPRDKSNNEPVTPQEVDIGSFDDLLAAGGHVEVHLPAGVFNIHDLDLTKVSILIGVKPPAERAGLTLRSRVVIEIDHDDDYQRASFVRGLAAWLDQVTVVRIVKLTEAA